MGRNCVRCGRFRGAGPSPVCKVCDREMLDEQRRDFDRWMQEQNCTPSGIPWDGFQQSGRGVSQ